MLDSLYQVISSKRAAVAALLRKVVMARIKISFLIKPLSMMMILMRMSFRISITLLNQLNFAKNLHQNLNKV